MKPLRACLIVMALLLPVAPAQALRLQQGEVLFDIDPATLTLRAGTVTVNAPATAHAVSELKQTATQADWQWPGQAMHISARLDGPDLRLTFRSERPQTLEWFTLPSEVKWLQLAIGEGSRIPLDDANWRSYLTRELSSVDTHFDLKLPLWGQEQRGQFYSWLLLAPFGNQVTFTPAGKRVMMRSSHEFNAFNQHQPFEVLLHAGSTPLSGALRYRDYLQHSGQFTALRDKMANAPDGKKLIGATHLYLWGSMLLAGEDVSDWTGLSAYLRSPEANDLWQHLDPAARTTLQSLAGRAPEGWQQASLIEAVNTALLAQVPLNSTPDSPTFLQAQQQQAVRLRQLAEQRLGKYLAPADSWGPGLSGPVIKALSQAGLSRLWLGTDNWTAVFLHPQAVEQAKEAGYLIASYDSYDTAIAPGVNDSWLTAQLPAALREHCAIVRADGTKKPGFGRKGYYLNPGCVLPFSRARMTDVIQLGRLNSLFLDVDGTGMASDDYQPEHPTGAAQMVADRNARMAWFSNTLKLPLGSEDGNAVTARHLMFAHGMETWGFGWGDKELYRNSQSPYYLGAWWPNAQPGTFFRPAKSKPLYRTVLFDPRYRLPLYQAVFHDAIITTHHWTYDNLKFSDVQTTRTLLGQLYNTPPLFNLSRSTLKARLPEIIKADATFRVLHEALWDKALTDFRWLDKTGLVQQTTFSDHSVLTANFGDSPFNSLAPRTLRARLADGRTLDFPAR